MKYYSLQFGTGDPRQFAGLSPTFLIFANMTTGATLTPPAITEVLSITCGIYQFQWGTTTPIAFLCDAATTSPGAAGRYVAGQLDPVDRADEYGTTMIAIGTTIIGQGVTNIALGTSNIALGTSNIALGVSNLAIGVSNQALGVSNLAQGLTTLGYGVSIYAQVQNNGTTLVAIGNSLAVLGTSLSIIIPAIGSTASSFGDASTDPSTLFGYLKRIQENLEGDSQYVKVSGIWSIFDRAASATLVVKTITNNATMVVKS